jgi:hypothetical protein
MAATALAAVISWAGFRIVSSSLVFVALAGARVVVVLVRVSVAGGVMVGTGLSRVAHTFFYILPIKPRGTTPTKNINNCH